MILLLCAHDFGTSFAIEIMLSLVHFEFAQTIAFPCEKFCIHTALNLALGINKTGLGDLQVSMSWPRTGGSVLFPSLSIQYLFCCFFLYTSVSTLPPLLHSPFSYFFKIYCTPSVLVLANSFTGFFHNSAGTLSHLTFLFERMAQV